LTDYRPVLLFDVRLVILPVGTAAGEGELLRLAGAQQVGVEELAAVVRIDSQQRNGQPRTHRLEGLTHRDLPVAPDPRAFGPSGRHIRHRQGVEILALGAQATMRDQINLHKADALFVPGRIGLYRHLLLEQRSWLGGPQPPALARPPEGS
jgi:hypothetical protein